MRPDDPRLSFAALSDIGQVRQNNEDVVFVDPVSGLAALADGLGGYQGGEVASAMAVAAIAGDLLADSAARSDPAVALRDAFTEANAAVFRRALGDPSCRGMATTLVVAWAIGEQIWIAHVGDSRAYRWEDGELQQLTRDHTVVQEQVEAGQLTPVQARRARHRNLLTRAVGSEAGVDVEIRVEPIRSGQQWLLCSDGLSDPVDLEEMNELLNRRWPPEKSARALVNLANARGGHDNVSVILIAVA